MFQSTQVCISAQPSPLWSGRTQHICCFHQSRPSQHAVVDMCQTSANEDCRYLHSCSHHSDTKSTKANSSGGLQADFNNVGPFAVPKSTSCVRSLASVTTAISRALLWRPVRLPADRFNNCRGHSSASHCTQDVVYDTIRDAILTCARKST